MEVVIEGTKIPTLPETAIPWRTVGSVLVFPVADTPVLATSMFGAALPTALVSATPVKSITLLKSKEPTEPKPLAEVVFTWVTGKLEPTAPAISGLTEPQTPSPHAPVPQLETIETVIDGTNVPVPPEPTAPVRSFELSSGVVLILPVADTPVLATVVLWVVLPTALVSATPVSAVVWATIPTEPLILGIGPVPASSMR